jgi:hypothetical protein
MIYTIVAVYSIDYDAVVDHVEGDTAQEAVNAFWADPEDGESRRQGCYIVSVFEGTHKDLCPFDMVGTNAFSFEEWEDEQQSLDENRRMNGRKME